MENVTDDPNGEPSNGGDEGFPDAFGHDGWSHLLFFEGHVEILKGVNQSQNCAEEAHERGDVGDG